MENTFCKDLLKYFPKNSELDELRSTYIANCVINNFLSYSTITFNLVTIYGIRKTSSLPKTLKPLLLSLAVSDVGVGIFVQPFYTSLFVRWLQRNNPGCISYIAFGVALSFFSMASFYGVVAISVDRFLAIHLHLRYQELVTHKRVVVVVISIWVLSLFLSFSWLWVPLHVTYIFTFITAAIGFVLATMAYTKIYLAVRHHKNQIQSLQVQQAVQSNEMANFAGLIKSAVGVFYVYLVFLICYLPSLIRLVPFFTTKGSNILLKRFFLFSYLLAFLNSSLNPVIYCWKMRQIRRAIMDILRDILAFYRNRALH